MINTIIIIINTYYITNSIEIIMIIIYKCNNVYIYNNNDNNNDNSYNNNYDNSYDNDDNNNSYGNDDNK
jgi:hypothetical protein